MPGRGVGIPLPCQVVGPPGQGERFGPSRRRVGLGSAGRNGSALGLGQHMVDGRCRPRRAVGPLPLDPGVAAPSECNQADDRGRQCQRQPPGLPLGPHPGLGSLGAGALGGAGKLGRPEPLLHARQMGRQPLGHDAPIPGPVLCLGRQAGPCQPQELRVGPAGIQPRHGVARVAPRRLALDLARVAAGERRRAGEGLAEDRAQREDVAPLVQLVDLAPRLLGAM